MTEPCPYCNGEKENEILIDTKDYHIYVSANAPLLVAAQTDFLDSFSQEICYCPMCGRKLEEV